MLAAQALVSFAPDDQRLLDLGSRETFAQELALDAKAVLLPRPGPGRRECDDKGDLIRVGGRHRRHPRPLAHPEQPDARSVDSRLLFQKPERGECLPRTVVEGLRRPVPFGASAPLLVIGQTGDAGGSELLCLVIPVSVRRRARPMKEDEPRTASTVPRNAKRAVQSGAPFAELDVRHGAARRLRPPLRRRQMRRSGAQHFAAAANA